MAYREQILERAMRNSFFREVLATGPHSQVVAMSIPPGGDIGEEVHHDVDQVLVFVAGKGEAVLEGERSAVGPGWLVQVPAGTRHNFVNNGPEDLRLYTVYAPPQHAPGTIHRTKAEGRDVIAEFRAFLLKTNALALAIGVIIGAALGAVVNSLVNDIIMPPIGMALGGVDFSQLKIVLQPAVDPAKEVAIRYGAFINVVIVFVIVALVVFLIARSFMKEAPAAPTKDCPFCKEANAVDATKCRACASSI
jgi:large conductance mechanosensitive channel protein